MAKSVKRYNKRKTQNNKKHKKTRNNNKRKTRNYNKRKTRNNNKHKKHEILYFHIIYNDNMKTNKSKIIVGKVHALWCHYCIEMAPVFQKIKMNSKYKDTVEFIEIEENDIEQEKIKINKKLNALNSLEVKGFPTLFLIKNKKIDYFKGTNTNSAEIENWINSFISQKGKKTRKNPGKKTRGRHLRKRRPLQTRRRHHHRRR